MTGRSGRAERPRKRLYSIREAGEYLGRTPWAIREMVWSGKLKAVKGDRRIFLDVEDLDRWIEMHKTERSDA